MRKLPPLHALRAFEAAARHLHFADAAEELGLTPTAISHQVRQLEDILGVTLFHRFPRPVRLTAAGEKLFPVLRQALDQIAGTIDQLSVTTAETPLRLSVTMAFASRWLMARLPRLRAETGLKITVEAADLPADLHASDIDMAIRYAGQPDGRAEWHRLVDDAIIPVCAPDLVNLPLSPESILALPLLDYRWKSASQNAPDWQRWHARADVRASLPAVAQTFSEEIHAIDAAVSGQGAVLASQLLVADLLNAGQLVQLSDIALPGLTYWAVFLSTHPDQDRLAHLLGWLRQQS
ncbi:LysR family transcriptional regulator [Sulfitobacter pseudonitzschiae]|uniref:LysR family transcriptional regulator n=1 Tax=Pseudosulfitobacter pseudonitzschiae TaxID=1402135 RepID=A0A9Q2NKB3_9RHOB|nr:LysR family transcriptional regulator [Pseudosulfitobacter pseudonitzschiae]MBM2293729.1 LysR family transcriptional regulator [Pseudosulfitobacter pseudonitzschiae]MBM2298543.1 LysR family transcriptional regulator [Pseudosulfitobacter pseudonitzschiae]MBM2303457.1 LysR family transcriptional regulator [Pseudosulfitobacter pseudonitzschiae]MBM2313240.1 LysR family transcriptional regulator [Pseudosulfitobacter pseudonitzschiae]MBM2318153.1 LysR family transcriptional regulator [Pseudosulfi